MATIAQDVGAIARSIFQSVDTVSTGRQSYLRLLVAAIQKELGAPERKNRPAKPAKLAIEEIDKQLLAAQAVHSHNYETVLEVASEFVPAGTKDRKTELHRRGTFARTALSAVRRYVRAGNDITAIPAARVTKPMLETPDRGKSVPTPTKGRVERQSKALMASVIGLADADKPAAVEEIRLLMGQLADQLARMGITATRNAAEAASSQKFLRVGKTLFAPTDTQVIRAAA